MGIVSLILIVLWVSLIIDGVFAIIKGYFPREQQKAEKHEPNAYHKWIRLSGVFIILCGVLNIALNIFDVLYNISDFWFIIFTIAVVVVVIAAISVSYRLIVKPADEKAGIKSDFKETIKKAMEESENKKQ